MHVSYNHLFAFCVSLQRADATEKAERMAAVADVLRKEMLPHVTTGEDYETKKAFFLGYMTNRLLQASRSGI